MTCLVEWALLMGYPAAFLACASHRYILIYTAPFLLVGQSDCVIQPACKYHNHRFNGAAFKRRLAVWFGFIIKVGLRHDGALFRSPQLTCDTRRVSAVCCSPRGSPVASRLPLAREDYGGRTQTPPWTTSLPPKKQSSFEAELCFEGEVISSGVAPPRRITVFSPARSVGVSPLQIGSRGLSHPHTFPWRKWTHTTKPYRDTGGEPGGRTA